MCTSLCFESCPCSVRRCIANFAHTLPSRKDDCISSSWKPDKPCRLATSPYCTPMGFLGLKRVPNASIVRIRLRGFAALPISPSVCVTSDKSVMVILNHQVAGGDMKGRGGGTIVAVVLGKYKYTSQSGGSRQRAVRMRTIVLWQGSCLVP